MFSVGIEFRLERTGCGFHIVVSYWLVHLIDYIQLVNDNCVDNNLKEILVWSKINFNIFLIS